MNNPADFARANKVVNARIGLYIHLTVYLVVNTLLVAINLATSTAHLWCKWPLLGWGVGLFAHGLLILALSRGRDVKAGMVERELRK